jgi:hypothetical protein
MNQTQLLLVVDFATVLARLDYGAFTGWLDVVLNLILICCKSRVFRDGFKSCFQVPPGVI